MSNDLMYRICAAGSAFVDKAPAAMETCGVQEIELGRSLGTLYCIWLLS